MFVFSFHFSKTCLPQLRSLFQVHKLLEDILGQWDSYHGELQAVNQTLAETEYCLQRYTMVGGDIATLKIQVEKLEVSRCLFIWCFYSLFGWHCYTLIFLYLAQFVQLMMLTCIKERFRLKLWVLHIEINMSVSCIERNH